MANELDLAAHRFRAALLIRERKAASEMVEQYGRIWRRISVDLAGLTKRIEERRGKGPIPRNWIFQQERYQNLMAAAEAELRKFETFADRTITGEQAAAVAAAEEHASALIRMATADKAPFFRMPKEAANELIGFSSDGSPLRKLLDSLTKETVAGARDSLITGVALGFGPRKIAREMQRGFGLGLTRGLLISRTETLRAYRAATIANYAANDDVVESWVWLCALGPRACAACIALHGTEHALTKRLPQHPNCRCVQRPKTKSWDELGFEGIPDARKPTTPGPVWFAKQPADVQRQILGGAGQQAYARGVPLESWLGHKHSKKWGPSVYQRSTQDAIEHAKAKPEPPKPKRTTPAGKPVSEAIRVEAGPRSPLHDIVKRTMEAIDSVHGDGNLPEIPVKVTGKKKVWGEYHYLKNGDADSITLRLDGYDPVKTLLHETAHFIDHKGLGKGLQFGSDIRTEMIPLWDAFDRTEAVKSLREALRTKQIDFNGRKIPSDVKFIRYSLKKDELWARAYAQWVMAKSGIEVNRLKTAYAIYWDEADFAEVSGLIEDLFEGMGWLKK